MKSLFILFSLIVSIPALADKASLKDSGIYFCQITKAESSTKPETVAIVANSAKEAVALAAKDFMFERGGNLLKVTGNNYEVISNIECEGALVRNYLNR